MSIINNRVEIIYGIDYITYACGGIGNARLAINSYERELFYTESEMLKRLSELKKEGNLIGDIKLFINNITEKEYKWE